MKRMYKNNEKKQRVRILATGELGTVTDRVLMKRSGTPMLYYQVKLESWTASPTSTAGIGPTSWATRANAAA